MLLALLIYGGELVFAIHMAWFKGELVICIDLRESCFFYLVYLYLLLFSCIFFTLT
jgi:hypothetical protein